MKCLLILVFCVGLLGLAMVPSAPVRADGVTKIVVIVNSAQKDAKDFEKAPSADTIKNIFLKKETAWKDGKEFSVIQQTGNTEYEIFRVGILSMTADQIAKHWSDKDIEDGTKQPKTVNSNADVYKWVANKKNAIGYVSESYFKDTLTEEERKKIHEIKTIAKQ